MTTAGPQPDPQCTGAPLLLCALPGKLLSPAHTRQHSERSFLSGCQCWRAAYSQHLLVTSAPGLPSPAGPPRCPAKAGCSGKPAAQSLRCPPPIPPASWAHSGITVQARTALCTQHPRTPHPSINLHTQLPGNANGHLSPTPASTSAALSHPGSLFFSPSSHKHLGSHWSLTYSCTAMFKCKRPDPPSDMQGLTVVSACPRPGARS